jgi:hypothetical protein
VLQRLKEGGLCQVQMTSSDPTQRKYYVKNDGEFMVAGPLATDAYRSFYFFPRTGTPSFNVQGSVVQLTSAAGQQIRIDTNTGKIVQMSNVTSFSEGPTPDQSADAQHMLLNITPQAGAGMLDLGYNAGGPPERTTNKASYVVGTHSCPIEMEKLFNQHYDSAEVLAAVDFRFKADSDFEKVIPKACKN